MISTRTVHRSGFVAVAGRPNVGKSTLVNHIIGQEMSIVTPKPQTTRNRISVVLTREDSQIVFQDTPGIHDPKTPLNKALVSAAVKTLDEADVILMVTTPESETPGYDDEITAAVISCRKPTVLAINKIDTVDQKILPGLVKAYEKQNRFDSVFLVSALKGLGIDSLVDKLVSMMPEAPRLFPEDDLSDLPVRFFVSEMIREQILRMTGEEIPYKSAVMVESYKEKKGLVHIIADIHIEKESQKRILVGKGGAMIKKIGTASRLKIEKFINQRVYLELFVKVTPGWTRDKNMLKDLVY
jgi:GTPase